MQKGVGEGIDAAALAGAVAIALSKNLTPGEQNILGNFITAVGASVLTIAAVAQTVSEESAESSSTAQASEKQNPKS